LANIKSAIKRNKQNEKKRVRNRVYRGAARTLVAKAKVAIEKKTPEEAKVAVLKAISTLDKSAQKGILHKNNAARRKSRLMKQLSAQAK
jgi:small subunit ribosomal protein S20